jgi:hypothetical protein
MSMNQNASAFARVGAKIVDQGFSAVPVMPGAKIPGELRRGEWRRMFDWQRFCERHPSELELEIWGKWEAGGVCVALGGAPDAAEQLVAVDVDSTDERIVEALRDILPTGLVEKCGAKGYTGFYRASQSVVTRTFDVDSIRAVDLLARGRQTVVPPSLHPQTGREYVWTTPLTLTDVTLDKLPLLPDDIVERLSVALAPFGRVAVSEPVRHSHDDDYCGPWTEANNAALDNFDAWLPLLGVQAERERDGSYRGPAVWRGGDNPTSVSYDHRGIRDFKMNEGLTPLDVVQRAGVAEGDWNADNWLREKLGLPVLPLVKFEFGPLFGREFAGVISIPYSQGAWVLRSETAAKPASSDPLDAIELGSGIDWTKPDGLLGRMAGWIETQMQNPNRQLAVLAAVATITPIVGWRNLYSPTGCALNGYYAGLAGTAVGKDSMLKLPGRLLATVRIPQKRLYSSSDAFSLSGQEGIVHKDPAILLALDEISTNMFPRMFGARANSHESAMRGMHMKLFGRNLGDPEYGFTARAPGAINQLEDARDPQFSMLAANTPRAFWQAMPQAAIADGYLNRWLIVNAGERAVNDNVVTEDVPEDIAQSLREISIGGREAVNVGMRPKGRQIPWASDDVRAAWAGMRDRLLPLIDSETTEGYLVGRTAEHAIRLATKHAIGSLGLDAKVGMQDLHWGAALALASAKATIAGAAMMANTDHARLVLEIETFVRKKKSTTLSAMTGAVRNGDPQKRELALKELVQGDKIEVTRAAQPGGGRPRVDIRWIG